MKCPAGGRLEWLLRWGCGTILLLGCLLVAYPYHPEVTYQARRITEEYPALNAAASVASALAEPVTGASSQGAGEAPGDWLDIPAIGVHERIVQGGDISVLNREKGAWHQAGSLNGNYVVAGHRFQYLPPNTETFYHLGKLRAGDKVMLHFEGDMQTHTYKVASVARVPADAADVLRDSGQPQLTLYTCGDSELKTRIVVVAIPVGVAD